MSPGARGCVPPPAISRVPWLQKLNPLREPRRDAVELRDTADLVEIVLEGAVESWPHAAPPTVADRLRWVGESSAILAVRMKDLCALRSPIPAVDARDGTVLWAEVGLLAGKGAVAERDDHRAHAAIVGDVQELIEPALEPVWIVLPHQVGKEDALPVVPGCLCPAPGLSSQDRRSLLATSRSRRRRCGGGSCIHSGNRSASRRTRAGMAPASACYGRGESPGSRGEGGLPPTTNQV